MVGKIDWACSVISVPERANTLLPRTLQSLQSANFSPNVFVDRDPKMGAYGRWLTALLETYIRFPTANRYMMTQDDLVMCKNVRTYLDRQVFAPRTYWNLYAFPQNTDLLRTQPNLKNFKSGFHPSTQTGLSALCLVFDRDGVQTLFADKELMRWSTCVHGKVGIDGRVCEAMRRAGYHEFVHHPSLVNHTGLSCSTIDHHTNAYPPCVSFRGEEFDALSLLPEQSC